MKFLITGSAGFIGFYVARRLLSTGFEVVGLDNLNDYYDVTLKESRLKLLRDFEKFKFYKLDMSDNESLRKLFDKESINRVIHLAAQAGVRYSIEQPHEYANSNLVGHLNILECCRHYDIEHLVYASSSSVYGLNSKTPFSTSDSVDHPVSLYAATKKSNELMSHCYSHLYNLPTTGLRFFTVYGPWGRPDMALFKFTDKIIKDEVIDVFNFGDLSRDFTFIDDIMEGIVRIQDVIPQRSESWKVETGSPATSSAPYSVYNIGNGNPVRLMDFISALEKALNIKANMNYIPMQPGDVKITYADTEDLFSAIGYKPKVDIESGVNKFVEWYKTYYEVSK